MGYRASANIFYGIFFEEMEGKPWEDIEDLEIWLDDLDPEGVLEIGNVGSFHSDDQAIYVGDSYTSVGDYGTESINLAELLQKEHPEWNRKLNEFCFKSGLTGVKIKHIGWHLSAGFG